VSSILCSRLLVIQTSFGSLLGDKQQIFLRNIRVFSKYCVCVASPEKKFSRILEDEVWKISADFIVGMSAATCLQTSRVCDGKKDFPPCPPSILKNFCFLYLLYRLLQLLYRDLTSTWAYVTEISTVSISSTLKPAKFLPSLKIKIKKNTLLCILVFYMWTRLWVVSCAHVYWWSKLRLAHFWETNNKYFWEI